MGARSDQIKAHIDQTRDALDGTIAQLRERVRPQRVAQRHPRAVLGAAAGVALLLGWLAFRAVRYSRRTSD